MMNERKTPLSTLSFIIHRSSFIVRRSRWHVRRQTATGADPAWPAPDPYLRPGRDVDHGPARSLARFFPGADRAAHGAVGQRQVHAAGMPVGTVTAGQRPGVSPGRRLVEDVGPAARALSAAPFRLHLPRVQPLPG